MERRKKGIFVCIVVSICLVFIACFSAICLNSQHVGAAESEKEVTVAFTHDLHSHVENFKTIQNGSYVNAGGFSRIATAINEIKAAKENVLLVDGGDYSMGTLYQTLYTTESAELSLMADMGYDAVTLGNHEFDYGEQALADSFTAAAAHSTVHPAMVVSNIDWDASGERGAVIKKGYEIYGGKDYTVITKGHVKIAVFGIFGEDSAACVNNSPLVFKDCVKSAKETVAAIKANESVDLIVCLSHSGTSSDASKSEDQILAKEVPDIDVIVSGHTHTTLEPEIISGNTYIVGCGCYGTSLGSISLKQNADGRWSVTDYALKAIDQSVKEDEQIKKAVEHYDQLIDQTYLSMLGLKKDQVVATNNITFEDAIDAYTGHDELRLGNLMSDAFQAMGREYAGLTDEVVIGIVPSGYIRETYVKGTLTVDDVFNSYSLGSGADGTIGYPLVCMYLTGSELKLAAEIDASLSDYMTEARLFVSGVSFSFNEHRMILNKVTDISLTDRNGNETAIENSRLYPVVVDLGTIASLGRIKSLSRGLLSIVPKDKDGNAVDDYNKLIIYNNGEEVKAWYSILEYMETFDKGSDGVAVIPEYYAKTHERKNRSDSWNLWELIRNPNKYAAMIGGIVAAFILGITAIVIVIVKCVKRHKKRKNC